MTTIYKELFKVDCTNCDPYGRWSYDNFVLNQPHINVEGLFEKNRKYYIVCPNINVETKAMDGENIYEWFRDNREIGCPIELVTKCPEKSVKIDERTIDELVEGNNNPKNLRDLFSSILMLLPKKFPKINLLSGNNRIIQVCVERELTKEEVEPLKDVLLKTKIPVVYDVVVDNEKANEIKSFRYETMVGGDIDIIPSKLIPFKVSNSLMQLIEKDEQFWSDNRISLFNGKINNTTGIMPDSWDKLESRCFLDASVFPQTNIRNYLSIYKKTIIALPLAESKNEILSSLKINENELVELAKMDRISFVLPQSIDRYPIDLLERIAYEIPESIILSRRLSALSIIDARHRFPFLYPTFGIKERAEILRILYNSIAKLSADKMKVMESVIMELARIWNCTEDMINSRGAMGTTFLGISSITAAILESTLGLDRYLEFYGASSLIEYAAPFSANVSPNIINEKYSDECYLQILADMYSGLNRENISLIDNKSRITLDGILSIDSNLPVIEFAKSFGSGDIERLRKLIFDITNNNLQYEDVDDIIRKFNEDVKNYESRNEKLAKWEISEFLKGIFTTAGTIIAIKKPEYGIPIACTPLAFWLIDALNKRRSDNQYVGQVIDTMMALISDSKPSAVMVARMKKDLSEKNKK